MAKLIFHITPHGPGLNVGNFAISKAIASLLKEIDNNISILTIDAYGSGKLSGLNKNVIHEANMYGSGIIVGGGNLYENNELVVDSNAINSLQVPLILFSLSIGRIFGNNLKLNRRTDVMPDKIIKNLNRASSFSLSRDFATYNYLRSIGIKNTKIGLCPTLFLNDYFISPNKFKSLGKNDILLVIRNPDLMNIPISHKPRITQFIKETYYKFKNKKIKVLCNDVRDISFVHSLGISEYIYTGDVEEYLTRLKNASLVISLRLHATLPCLSFGTRCINISYDERSMSLMDSIGLQKWDIKIFKDKNIYEAVLRKIDQLNIYDNMLIQVNKNIKKYKKIQQKALKVF